MRGVRRWTNAVFGSGRETAVITILSELRWCKTEGCVIDEINFAKANRQKGDFAACFWVAKLRKCVPSGACDSLKEVNLEATQVRGMSAALSREYSG